MEQINLHIQNTSNDVTVNAHRAKVAFKFIINYLNHHFKVFIMYVTL